jgi:O-antigen biosynthesis protein WbqP
MNDFFKTKVAFLIGFLSVLIILVPFVSLELDTISINIFKTKITAISIYYLVIASLFLSLLSYAVLFIKEGKLKIFKVLGDLIYPIFIILLFLFFVVFLIQNVFVLIITTIDQKILALVVLFALLIILIYFIRVLSKRVDIILKKVAQTNLDYAIKIGEKRKTNLYNLMKRIVDIIFSLTSLILFAPLILIISIAIRLESGRPVFIKHQRIGRNGIRFNLIGFRVLKNHSSMDENINTERIGSSRTVSGKILKRTGLDEIPKLLNVFVGDLSLVGPFPLIQNNYSEFIDNRFSQNIYTSVKPGTTGLGIILEENINNFSLKEIIKYDMYYIIHRSIKLDCIILFATMKRVLKS